MRATMQEAKGAALLELFVSNISVFLKKDLYNIK